MATNVPSGEIRWPPAGRNDGHQWGINWPLVGRNRWPLTRVPRVPRNDGDPAFPAWPASQGAQRAKSDANAAPLSARSGWADDPCSTRVR